MCGNANVSLIGREVHTISNEQRIGGRGGSFKAGVTFVVVDEIDETRDLYQEARDKGMPGGLGPVFEVRIIKNQNGDAFPEIPDDHTLAGLLASLATGYLFRDEFALID